LGAFPEGKLAKLGELTKSGHPAKIATHYPYFERVFTRPRPQTEVEHSILLWRNKIAAQHQEGPAISRFDRR
jgi:hypothetical protein